MEQQTYVATNVRFPKEVHEALVALAGDQRRSVNSTVVVAVERYIKQMRARRVREGVDER